MSVFSATETVYPIEKELFLVLSPLPVMEAMLDEQLWRGEPGSLLPRVLATAHAQEDVPF